MKKIVALLLMLMLLPCFALAEGLDAQKTGDFSERYADKFLAEGEEPIVTETSYRSHDICVEISAFREEDSDVYVADIYVRDLRQFRRGYGASKWGKGQQYVGTIAQKENAIIALTGDDSKQLKQGIVIGNGEVLRTSTNAKRQLCVIYEDGEMAIVPGKLTSEEAEQLKAQFPKVKSGSARTLEMMQALDERKIWHVFMFGPALLDDTGMALEEFDSNVKPANPRAVLGYYAPGHYCLVQVDGRGVKSKLEPGKTSRGLKMSQLAVLMEMLGCKQAYNLDGGQSAAMWFNGNVISTPYNDGRQVVDAIVFLPNAPTE